MRIEKHSIVSMHYTLKDHEGELVETTIGESPLTVLIGAEQIPSAFEDKVMGLSIGDKKQIVLSAEEGYGEYDEDLIQEWEREKLADINPLEIGDVLEFEDEEGDLVEGEVIEINGDTVVIDFNHPLAGEELHYEIQVTDIRPATPEEIAHGHVH